MKHIKDLCLNDVPIGQGFKLEESSFKFSLLLIVCRIFCAVSIGIQST